MASARLEAQRHRSKPKMMWLTCLLLAWSGQALAQADEGIVSTIVSLPAGTVVRGMTTWQYQKDIVWVALSDHTIRTLNLTTGKMTVFAGAPGVAGYLDGAVGSFAGVPILGRLTSPTQMLVHPNRPWILITEQEPSAGRIRMIQQEYPRIRTMWASTAGEMPWGLANNLEFDVYISFPSENIIKREERFIAPWVNTPFQGIAPLLGSVNTTGDNDKTGSGVPMRSPSVLTWSGGKLWWTESNSSVVRSWDPETNLTRLVMGTNSTSSAYVESADPLACTLNTPYGLAWGPGPTLYIADSLNHVVRQINSSGVASRFIGLPGVAGGVDGSSASATLSTPQAISVTMDGTALLVGDSNGIRLVTLPPLVVQDTVPLSATVPEGSVGTFVGSGLDGFLADAMPNSQAILDAPVGLATHPLTGDLYVSLPARHIILRVTNTTTYVELGVPGVSSQIVYNATQLIEQIGPAEGFHLNRPTALVFMPGTDLLIFSELYPRCNVRSYNTTSRVLAAVAGTSFCGFWTAQGSGPAFTVIGEVVDMVLHPATGELYMVDTWVMGVIKMPATLNRFKMAAGLNNTADYPVADALGKITQALFSYPQGLAFHPLPPYHLFIGDTLNGKVKRLNMDSGLVELVAGVGTGCTPSTDPTPPLSACLSGPRSLWVDPSGVTLYIADGPALRMVRLNPASGLPKGPLTTLAGSGVRGSTDGIWSASRFQQVTKMVEGMGQMAGSLLISDMLDGVIRVVALPPPPVPDSSFRPKGIGREAVIGAVVGASAAGVALIVCVFLAVRTHRRRHERAQQRAQEKAEEYAEIKAEIARVLSVREPAAMPDADDEEPDATQHAPGSFGAALALLGLRAPRLTIADAAGAIPRKGGLVQPGVATARRTITDSLPPTGVNLLGSPTGMILGGRKWSGLRSSSKDADGILRSTSSGSHSPLGTQITRPSGKSALQHYPSGLKTSSQGPNSSTALPTWLQAASSSSTKDVVFVGTSTTSRPGSATAQSSSLVSSTVGTSLHSSLGQSLTTGSLNNSWTPQTLQPLVALSMAAEDPLGAPLHPPPALPVREAPQLIAGREMFKNQLSVVVEQDHAEITVAKSSRAPALRAEEMRRLLMIRGLAAGARAAARDGGVNPITGVPFNGPFNSYTAAAPEVMHTGQWRWTRGQLLGSGAYGKVYAGLNQETGQLMAVKELKVQTSMRIQDMQHELSLCQQLCHPHVVVLLGSHLDILSGHLYIFMEYVGGGSIADMLRKFGRFPEAVVCKYARQILLGLTYMHQKRIIHRDLKGANVLVTLDGVVKLADFGASRSVGTNVGTFSTSVQSLKGSVFWISPEMVKGTGYGRRTDIWSLGCTVIEMLTGQHPWPNLSGEQNAWTVMFQVANTKTGPPRPEGISAEAQDFLNRCLCFDAKDRATAEELLSHPFVTSEDE